MGFRSAFIPIMSLLFLWLISSQGLAVRMAAAGEQDPASTNAQPDKP